MVVPITRSVPPAARERVIVLEMIIAGLPGKSVVPSTLKPVGAAGVKSWLAEVVAGLSGRGVPVKEIVEVSIKREDVSGEVLIPETLENVLGRTVLLAVRYAVGFEVKAWLSKVMVDDEEACGNSRVGALIIDVEGLVKTAVSDIVIAGARLDKDREELAGRSVFCPDGDTSAAVTAAESPALVGFKFEVGGI